MPATTEIIKTRKTRLSHAFYDRYCIDVARDLLGKTLVFGHHRGIITETEAYRGDDDEASHAFGGVTPRCAVMAGPPGYSYVYLIYGMYHCLNIVTESEGHAGAVLIRGLKLSDAHLDGPGKLCRYLSITKAHGGINMVTSSELYVIDEGISVVSYQATSRIGIKKAQDKLWRFVMEGS